MHIRLQSILVYSLALAIAPAWKNIYINNTKYGEQVLYIENHSPELYEYVSTAEHSTSLSQDKSSTKSNCIWGWVLLVMVVINGWRVIQVLRKSKDND